MLSAVSNTPALLPQSQGFTPCLEVSGTGSTCPWFKSRRLSVTAGRITSVNHHKYCCSEGEDTKKILGLLLGKLRVIVALWWWGVELSTNASPALTGLLSPGEAAHAVRAQPAPAFVQLSLPAREPTTDGAGAGRGAASKIRFLKAGRQEKTERSSPGTLAGLLL